MAQYRTSEIRLGNSKLDKVLMAAWIIVIAAGLVFVEAGIFADVCGTQTEKDVSGVERQLELPDVKGIELDPLPKFTYAATCGKGERRITKCSFTSEDATPKTSEVQLPGPRGRAEFTLKKDDLVYKCNFYCYDVASTDFSCTYPLLDAVCKNKKSGTVSAVPIPVRAIDINGAANGIELPTVNYDADCDTKKITKCSIPSKAVANPGETSNAFLLPVKATSGKTRFRSCSMTCLPQDIATLKCQQDISQN